MSQISTFFYNIIHSGLKFLICILAVSKYPLQVSFSRYHGYLFDSGRNTRNGEETQDLEHTLFTLANLSFNNSAIKCVVSEHEIKDIILNVN